MYSTAQKICGACIAKIPEPEATRGRPFAKRPLDDSVAEHAVRTRSAPTRLEPEPEVEDAEVEAEVEPEHGEAGPSVARALFHAFTNWRSG